MAQLPLLIRWCCLLIVVSGSGSSDQIIDKVLVDHSGNLVNPRPIVKPTAASVAHEPGVPPPTAARPTSRPTTSTNTNNPFNWFASFFRPTSRNVSQIGEELDGNYTENFDIDTNFLNDTVELVQGVNLTSLIQSEQLMLNNNFTFGNFGSDNPPNKGVIDWLLGLVGITTNNNNNNNNKPKPEPDTTNKCGHCSCGLTFKHTRIVGGIETQVNAYPWMAILTYNNRFYCGASVINNKYLLTATHCVNGFNKDHLGAIFLDHDRSTPYETRTFTRKIAGVLKHKGYGSGGTYNNDISLLRLDQEVQFNGLLRPVCLPTVGKSYTGFTGVVTGWGATHEHGQVSQKLREVEVPIMSNIDCRKTGYGAKITDNMMCAGYKEGGKDSCQGDSGGPLHVVNKTAHTIVGIVSWGEGCAEANYPGVYTRVNRYITWIRSNTKDACYCS